MRAQPSDPTPSAPSETAPSVPSVPLPDAGPTDERPNRAARRGYREGTVPGAHGRGAAPHARGAQGRPPDRAVLRGWHDRDATRLRERRRGGRGVPRLAPRRRA